MRTHPDRPVSLEEAVQSVVRPKREIHLVPSARTVRRGLILLALAVPIAAWTYIANYQPLGRGSSWSFSPPHSDQCQTSSEQVTAPASGEDFVAIFVQCPRDGQADWGWTWANEGPLPVRIERVVHHNGPQFMLDTRLGGEVGHGIGRFDELAPWRSFTLRADETRVFSIRFRGPGCRRDAGGATIITDQEIHFRVLGIPRRDRVPTPWSAEIAC